MPAFKPQQRRLTIANRVFHFVSYEGSLDHRHADPDDPPMWFLMVEGHRWPVFRCDPHQSPTQVDAALSAWVEGNVLAQAELPLRRDAR